MSLAELEQSARSILESLPTGALVFAAVAAMAAMALVRAIRSAFL
jgi:hypothetical protein